MAIVRFVSGSAITIIGSFQEITEAVGFSEKIPQSKIIGYAVVLDGNYVSISMPWG